MPLPYDAIVIGTGGVGSAALYHLAARGARVLGLDQFPPGHDRGSSHGQTRIIRLAYFEHPDYVPLLRRAYQLWSELGECRGRPLYHEVGLLQVGPPEAPVVSGVRRSAQVHGLEIEDLSPAEITRRFPGFHAGEDCVGVFERRAGYLEVEACVIAHLEEAIRLGAELRTGLTVQGWRGDSDGLTVATDAGQFHAERLVLAPGSWAPQLLGDLQLRLEVRRKPQFWYPSGAEFQADRGCPAFLFDTPEGVFYGLPQIDERGLKVAGTYGRQSCRRSAWTVDRTGRSRRAAMRVEGFLAEYLPQVGRPLAQHSVCLYTLTPDEHFVVDRHPSDPRVVLAAGLSGHGFKFTGVLGEISLADLGAGGEQFRLPIGFLSLSRPGLRR